MKRESVKQKPVRRIFAQGEYLQIYLRGKGKWFCIQ